MPANFVATCTKYCACHADEKVSGMMRLLRFSVAMLGAVWVAFLSRLSSLLMGFGRDASCFGVPI